MTIQNHSKIWGIASDHAGFTMKESLVNFLHSLSYEVNDLGPDTNQSVDYPDYAKKLVLFLQSNPDAYGILICGSGIGMSIAANRHSFIRAALCRTVNDALLAKQHNNANVLIFGGRVTLFEEACAMVESFARASFEAGRHSPRVQKLSC